MTGVERRSRQWCLTDRLSVWLWNFCSARSSGCFPPFRDVTDRWFSGLVGPDGRNRRLGRRRG